MLKNIIVLSLMLMPLASCQTPDSGKETGNPAGSSLAPDWVTLYSCSDDNVVVDVDKNDRTHLQLVIRDPDMFVVFDANEYSTFRTSNSSERIYQGHSLNGAKVQTASNLNFYEITPDNKEVPESSRLGFDVRREGTNELRFRSLDLKLCADKIRTKDFPEECTREDAQSHGKKDYIFKACH